ncbi:MAG: ParA family partition ATPase [Acidibrevibacterium sp.]|uniref:ParA family partition ATPase n=1 Tax=Acidibrevibacterium sp. TaxID=2606776 RepID=UPI003CFE9B29
MAVVLTIAQQKGGAGKTTLAAHLGVAFAATRRVALLDIDPQKSLARWFALRTALPAGRERVPLGFSDVSGWRLRAELDRLKRDFDMILIDSPPEIATDARTALRAADLVLVPIQPSPPDLWAAEGTLALAASERRTVHLVFNRASAASRLRQTMAADIAERGLALLTSALGNRAGFANAFARGLGISEAAPNSRAGAELTALAGEISGLLA